MTDNYNADDISIARAHIKRSSKATIRNMSILEIAVYMHSRDMLFKEKDRGERKRALLCLQWEAILFLTGF